MVHDSIVIGGGFYGISIALELSRYRSGVRVVEAGGRLLDRASQANQARIHGGYHYPRSFLTAKRSRANYSRFLQAYPSAVVDSFPHYYAIASSLSHIDSRQFTEVCKRIDAPLKPAPVAVKRWFDSALIEEVFEVQECVFDVDALRAQLHDEIEQAGILVTKDCRVLSVRRPDPAKPFVIECAGKPTLQAKEVWLCVYSGLNPILEASGFPPISLRLEPTEMALVEPPSSLGGAGITVMDGPFFSLLPYPSKKCFTLSHVRYTPHSAPPPQPSHFDSMRRDAARYLPALNECRQMGSIWETKALLQRSDRNDSRPILFQADYGVPGQHCVLGGKLDNIFDALDEVSTLCKKGSL